MTNEGFLFLGLKQRLWKDYENHEFILRLGMSVNASKRNIFEDEGSWGLGLKYKH